MGSGPRQRLALSVPAGLSKGRRLPDQSSYHSSDSQLYDTGHDT